MGLPFMKSQLSQLESVPHPSSHSSLTISELSGEDFLTHRGKKEKEKGPLCSSVRGQFVEGREQGNKKWIGSLSWDSPANFCHATDLQKFFEQRKQQRPSIHPQMI